MSFNQKNRKFQGFPALNYGHKLLEEGLDLVPLAYRLESLSYKCLISLQRCIYYSGITIARHSPLQCHIPSLAHHQGQAALLLQAWDAVLLLSTGQSLCPPWEGRPQLPSSPCQYALRRSVTATAMRLKNAAE